MPQPEARFAIRADDKTRAAFKSIESNVKNLTGRVLNMKIAVAGLVGVGGFGALIRDITVTTKETKAYADALNVSVLEMSAWGYAVEDVSLSQEKLNDILKDTSEKIGDAYANQGGEAVEVLEKLNLSAKEMAALSPDQQLLKIAEQLDRISTRSEKVQILESLASDASLLLPLLENDAERFRALRMEAIEFGVAISDVDAAKIEAANDAFVRTKNVIKGAATTITTELALPLEAVTNAFTETLVGNKEDIQATMRAVIQGSGVVLEQFGELWAGFQRLPDWAQNVGIVGAFLGGKKGVVLLAAISKFAEDSKTTAEWWEAYSTDKIGFIEWFTTGHDEAAQRLDALKKEGVITAQESATETENVFLELAERLKNLDFDFQIPSRKKSDGGDSGDGGMIEVLDQQLQARVERIQQSFLDEETLEVESYWRKLEDLDEFYENKIDKEAEYKEMLEELEAQHLDNLLKIRTKSLSAEEKFLALSNKQKVANILATGTQMTQGVAQSSKEMFQINKALALANAAVSLPDAILKSFQNAGGYPWGLVPAALMAATGAAQIAAIAGASFGGGQAAPSLAGQGGGSQTVNTVPIGTSSLAQDREPEQQDTVVIRGVDPSQIFTGQQVRDLAETLLKNDKRGVSFV